MARHNKPIWISAGISAALLIAFFFVQSWDSDILGLPVQYLLLALVPLVIGLLMSGYIREVKAGGVGLTVADEALKSSTPIPDSGQLQAEAHMVSGGWQVGRATEYKRTRGYMLAHVYKTS